MATPVERGGHGIDEATLERFTRSLVSGGVHGLFPGSSIGEFPSLTPEQNRTVVRTVAAAADDETTVLAGCSDTSVDSVVENVDAAERAGADAAVVVTPYYLETTQNGLHTFFERVAERASLPLLLYNIPALTGNDLSVETVRDLATVDRVVGLKDTSGDMTYQYEVIAETPEEFAVFQGATELASTALDVGADGLIAGPANIFPEAMAELYDAHGRGDDETVDRIAREVVFPLVTETSKVPTAAAIKCLVGLDGLDVGPPLPPLPALSESDRARLEDCYRRVAEAAEVVAAAN